MLSLFPVLTGVLTFYLKFLERRHFYYNIIFLQVIFDTILSLVVVVIPQVMWFRLFLYSSLFVIR